MSVITGALTREVWMPTAARPQARVTVMTYTTAEGRQRILGEFGDAADQIALALAYLGEAYELLDDTTGDRLEEVLFGPVQAAYGRAKRAHGAFAQRVGLEPRAFGAPPSAGLASQGAHVLIDRAIEAAGTADHMIGELQDSMLPVEVGDAELREGLSGVRQVLAPVPVSARGFLRTLGR